MQKVGQFLSKLLGVVFAALFILTALFSILLITAERTLLNPDSLKAALEQSGLYERLPELSGAEVEFADALTQGSNTRVGYLSSRELEDVIEEVIPPDWVQDITEEVIDGTFAWLRSEDDDLRIRLSMRDLKRQIGGREGVEAARTIIRSWPPCTPAEERAFLNALDAGNWNLLPECSPADYILQDNEFQLENLMGYAAEAVKDHLVVTTADIEPEDEEDEDTAYFQIPDPNETLGFDLRAQARTARILVYASPLLTLAMLLLMTAAGVRSFRDFLQWWGGALLILGLVAVLAGLVLFGARIAARQTISERVADPINALLEDGGIEAELPNSLAEAAYDLAGVLINRVAVRVGLAGLLVGLVGGMLLLALGGVKLAARPRRVRQPEPALAAAPSPPSAPEKPVPASDELPPTVEMEIRLEPESDADESGKGDT